MVSSHAPLGPSVLVSQVLSSRPAASAIFLRRGMACPGCAMANFMSVAEAAAAYDVPVDDLLAELERGVVDEASFSFADQERAADR